MPVKEQRFANSPEKSANGGVDRLSTAAVEQQREFVATEPCGSVRRGQLSLEPLGDLYQQPVTRRMPQAVVDGLDVVEIDERHGQEATSHFLRRARGQVMRQSVQDQRAVG